MSKIRIGFIGLNATSSWGVSAHLPYLKDSSKYEIVALSNSTAEKARAAISAHNLPSTTKAYGSSAELATDPDVDLVVCSVRVDQHHPVLKPVLRAGKDVYCEWPLGKNLAEGEELAALARTNGVKTVVGLQGRRAPVSLKVKELIDAGRIGKVLSVTATLAGYNFGPEELETLSWMSDREVGGNLVTIHFSHVFDLITQTVGQLNSYTSILEVKRPETKLRDKPLTEPSASITGTVPRTSHDQILIQGHLESGALLSFHLRGGTPIPGTPGIVWQIYGSTGEIRVTASSALLSVGSGDTQISLHDQGTGAIETVEVPTDEFDELPLLARNVARVYDAFAEARTDEYADWEEAVVRHRLVDELYRRERAGGPEEPSQYLSETYGASLEL